VDIAVKFVLDDSTSEKHLFLALSII